MACLKPRSEPDGCSNAQNEAYDVDTDLVDSGDNEGPNAHGFLIVEVTFR
jgi:hypothetical protein